MLAETESESGSERGSVSDVESNAQEHMFDNCLACKARRQQAHSSSLPAVVVNGKYIYIYISLGLLQLFRFFFFLLLMCKTKSLILLG